MIMNSVLAQHVAAMNLAAIEHGRLLQDHCRNVDRLIAYNNKRIRAGLRPLAIPTAMVKHGRALLNNPPHAVDSGA